MTICCSKCGRPLYEDIYDDTKEPQQCEPSCEQLERDIEEIKTFIWLQSCLKPPEKS